MTLELDSPDQVTRQGEELQVDLWYPRNDGVRVRVIVVGLVDVRAADGIRISYDFERDGWKVEQCTGDGVDLNRLNDPDYDVDKEQRDEQWIEAAFLPAWQMQGKFRDP